MISDSLILRIIHDLKTAVSNKEKDLSRAIVSDLYAFGRSQGSLDGLEQALGIIDTILEDDRDDDER